MIMFNPADWYWQVTGVGVYGSSRRGLVSNPETDAAYLAFEAISGSGSIAADTSYLDATLQSSIPPQPASGLTPPTKAQSLAYANSKQWSLATGGYTITIDGTAIVFPSDVVSMGLITGKAARLAQPSPPASFAWQTPTGFVTIAAADFIAMATQVADFVQATFDALQSVLAGIEAGTITTTAAIDEAAWPSNVSSTTA